MTKKEVIIGELKCQPSWATERPETARIASIRYHKRLAHNLLSPSS